MLMAGFLLFQFMCGCVAKSGHDLRFKESAVLNAPDFNVSGVEDGDFSFLFVGDIHLAGTDSSRLDSVLQAAQTRGDAFIIFLGDLVEKGDRADFETFKARVAHFGFQDKVIYVIGNHDVFNDGWLNYRELFGPSHFAIDFGHCRFVVIDSADGIVGEKQSDWIEEQLRSNSGIQHTFLLSHYMPVVPGQRTYLKLSNETEAAQLMKMMSRLGVEAWLGGHYHSYSRESIEGVNYIVAGGGGGRRMDPVRDLFYVRALVQGASVTYELNRF